MGGVSLRKTVSATVSFFKELWKPRAVFVDRDYVRTTLYQCESEVREFHRILKERPKVARDSDTFSATRH